MISDNEAELTVRDYVGLEIEMGRTFIVLLGPTTEQTKTMAELLKDVDVDFRLSSQNLYWIGAFNKEDLALYYKIFKAHSLVQDRVSNYQNVNVPSPQEEEIVKNLERLNFGGVSICFRGQSLQPFVAATNGDLPEDIVNYVKEVNGLIICENNLLWAEFAVDYEDAITLENALKTYPLPVTETEQEKINSWLANLSAWINEIEHVFPEYAAIPREEFDLV